MKSSSKETSSQAGICLPRGLSIGYESTLAEVQSEITLGTGTHYLLGRNGRGKTTLFRTLCGMLKPLDGAYEISGSCRFVSEDLVFDSELTAPMILKALLEKDAAKEAIAFAKGIELDLKKPFGKLSTGNKRKVNLLVSEFGFQHDGSDIIFLDEPFTGLDAPTRQAFLDRWEQDTNQVIRLVSAHPDFDDMSVPSALVISDGSLMHQESNEMTWGQLRKFLN